MKMTLKSLPVLLSLYGLTATPVLADPAPSNATSAHTSSPYAGNLTSTELLKIIGESKDYLPFDIDVPGQSFVSTGPYVGVPIVFSGSNLIINSPSVNTDVILLGIRKKIHDQLSAMGGTLYKEPYHSHLLLSGIVEGQANWVNVRGGTSTSYIDVTNMTIDFFFIGPSDWTLGLVELTYDNTEPRQTVFGSVFDSAYTVLNSRVFVNKAFFTIGDFSQSPLYATVGQVYVPFGIYSSVLVTNPLTKDLGRTKARVIQFGAVEQSKNGIQAAGYVFKGDSYTNRANQVNSGGVSVAYNFDNGTLSGTVGVGVIGSITDSVGMQAAVNFQSFEHLHHRVPGYNVNATLAIGSNVDFIFEYVGTSNHFDVRDMSFRGEGAKPWAIDFEGSYSFYVCTRPSSIGLAYGQSGQLLAMGLPQRRFSAVFNTSIWRNTLQSIEFAHNEVYSKHAYANGPWGARDVPIYGGFCTAAACNSNGKPYNAVTAQFDYYF